MRPAHSQFKPVCVYYIGASESTTRRVFAAPTPQSTPSTPSAIYTSTLTLTISRTPAVNHPDPCHTSLDAISVIRGQVVAFKSNVSHIVYIISSRFTKATLIQCSTAPYNTIDRVEFFSMLPHYYNHECQLAMSSKQMALKRRKLCQ